MIFSSYTSHRYVSFRRSVVLAIAGLAVLACALHSKPYDTAQGQDLEQLEQDVGLDDGPVLGGLNFRTPDYPDAPAENIAKEDVAPAQSDITPGEEAREDTTMPVQESFDPILSEGDPGSLFGRVADAETIAFVGDALVSVVGADNTAKTDDSGNYIIEGLQPGIYTVAFSKQGYVRVRVTEVEILSGERKKLDMTLQPDYGGVTELDAVTMTISSLDTSEVMLLAERKEAYSFQDSIGADDFARFGVDDAAGALSKVTGVSVQDGKYIVVRGLSDRYNNTMLNGLLVPTPDPDKKAVQLDLFPSKLLENIIVTKTFTPDQPGDFTGGSVNLITQTFPDAYTASTSLSLGFNTNATFNDDFLTYDGGVWDIFGFDDGTRDIPAIADDYDVTPGQSFPVGSAESQYVTEVTQAFNSSMTPYTQAPGPNVAFNGSIADSTEIGGKPVGVVASVSYDLENNYYGDGLNQRIDTGSGTGLVYDYQDRQASQTVLLGGLLSLGWEFAPENSINFTSIYNRATENDARVQTGTNNVSSGPPGATEVVRSLSFVQREIYTFNLTGDHTLTGLNDININWALSQAHTSQEEPDTRYFNSYILPSGAETIDRNGKNPERLWRDLQEERPTAKLDVTVPLNDYWKIEGNSLFKTGGYYMQSSREFSQTVYNYNRASTSTTRNTVDAFPPNLPGGADNFPDPADAGFPPSAQNPNTNPYYVITSAPGQSYTGYERVRAGYAMADLAIFEDVQFLGGVRFEQTLMSTVATVASNPYGDVSNGYIKQTDALPAVALSYAVTDDVNIRVAFSQTIARPTMRELAPYNSVDFLGGDVFIGNPTLQLSNVDNFDFRVEWFPDAGEVLAFSFFYKELGGPIERVMYTVNGAPNDFLVSPFNANQGTMYGVELEMRKSLSFISPELENFSINANATIIDATVNVGGFFSFSNQPGALQVNVQDRDRRLQGQPKYIVNLGLNYDNIDWGTSISLNFNKTSDVLYAAAADTAQFPDVYETGVPTLDLIIRQAIAENWTLTFSAKNLTNPNFERYYANGVLYSVNDAGRSFSIGASYSFE